MNNISIRAYKSSDREKVLQLLKLNIPKYFDEGEFQDLEIYLDSRIDEYFVVEEEGKIIGSGGINFFREEREARISWDIFDPACQGKGYGSKLTQFRINRIKEEKGIDKIIVRTTQLVYKFYEKSGFELQEVKADYWAEGFDLYKMVIKL